MVLRQVTMNMSTGQGASKKLVPKLVLLWEKVGLCVHKGSYVGKHDKVTYHVSHFSSGMSVLRGARSLEEAKQYMQQIHDKVLEDWRFTLADWESEENSELKSELKPAIDKLQKEIWEGA